ncbi:MAG: Methionine synthase [Nitrosopumilales archaeon]|nr:MAG: Methionine synthase [Nitrosopumilales archaeon]
MSRKLFPTQEIGSLKKPSWLLKTVKNPRTSNQEKVKARNDAALLNIRTLEDLGLDIVYDGEVRRVEMYEEPVRYIKGFEFAGRVRSWDNKYYKKARVTKPVSFKSNFHKDEFKFIKKNAKQDIKVPVTGAYTLADWSYDEHYKSKEDLVLSLAKRVIRPLLKDLVRLGAKIIQIDEPAATSHPLEMEVFRDSVNESVRGINAKIIVHACFSGNEYEALAPQMPEIKAKQFTLEFANRDSWNAGTTEKERRGYRVLNLFREHGYKGEIGIGVTDVHVDRIEPSKLVRDRILYAAKALGDPTKIYVNPDCGLRTRSRKVAFEKIKSLVQGAELAREKLGN